MPPGGEAGFVDGRRAIIVLVGESRFAACPGTRPARTSRTRSGRGTWSSPASSIVPSTTARNRSQADAFVRDLGWLSGGLGRSWDSIDCDDDDEVDIGNGSTVVCAPWLDPTDEAAAAATMSGLVTRMVDAFGINASM